MDFKCYKKKLDVEKIRSDDKKLHADEIKSKEKKKSSRKKKDRLSTASNISIHSSIENKNIEYTVDRYTILLVCLFRKKYKNFICPFKNHFKKPSSYLNLYLKYILINLHTNEIEFDIFTSDQLANEIRRLIHKKKERFIYIPIYVYDLGTAHANFILIDKNDNEAYYFEPYGVFYPLPKKINDKLKKYIRTLSAGIKINFPEDYLEDLPFQQTDELHAVLFKSKSKYDFKGYCFYWCLYIFSMILKHDYKPIKILLIEIALTLHKFSGKKKKTDYHRHIRVFGINLEREMQKIYRKKFGILTRDNYLLSHKTVKNIENEYIKSFNYN